jgi:hypothetical protein
MFEQSISPRIAAFISSMFAGRGWTCEEWKTEMAVIEALVTKKLGAGRSGIRAID